MMTAPSLRRCAVSPGPSAGGFFRRPRWGALGVGLLSALVAALAGAGCNHAGPAKEQKRVEVTVTTPITAEVVDHQDFTGRLDAFKTVDIRARVSGYVVDAPFKEGDVVKEGDVLFQIDPQTYQADYNLADANLRLAEADADLQEKIANRARRLRVSGGNSEEDLETAIAAAAKSKASVGACQASRDRAKLYLGYTKVIVPPLRDDQGRPLTGRVSRRYVDPGNLVTADNTVLTTIVTETPVYAYFDVDERTFLELKMAATPGKSMDSTPLLQSKVLMRLANEDKFKRLGVVNFIDNRVTATSGTIRMRGVFDNSKGDLKSGLFARVRMPTSKPYTALLVPDEALQSDQGKKFLYVVTKDPKTNEDKIEYKPVELGQAIEGLRVIRNGLKEGERVVVVGMQRVRPNQAVEVKTQDPPKPPESSLAQILKSQGSGIRNQESGAGE
jgi:RND family efflux transporter MFP subunit